MQTKFAEKSLSILSPKLATMLAKGRVQAGAMLERLTRDQITDEIGGRAVCSDPGDYPAVARAEACRACSRSDPWSDGDGG